MMIPILLHSIPERIRGGAADPCKNNPCRNGGQCVVTGDSFQCNCPSDWTGPTCEGITRDCFMISNWFIVQVT